jgi:hypothetical protein
MAAREARGARRGELRCPDMFARSGPAPIGAISMTTSLVKLSPSWRPGACRAVTRIMPHGRVWRVDRLAVRHKGHATGHRSRLNRDLNGSYGTKKYAFEELVAELSAAFGWQLIDHLKKADMAKEAERLLDGSGWLPGAAASHRRRASAGRAGWRSRTAARIPCQWGGTGCRGRR